MKKLIGYSSALMLAVVLTGCVGPMQPIGGVGAAVYTDVSGPLMVTSHTGASKVGQAEATGLICFATGDASIKAACDKAGITKIQHVDYHTKSVLGLYAKTVVTVYGE